MEGWLTFAVVAALVVIVMGAGPLALLAGRRRWLERRGGCFECSVRVRTSTPRAGWALGMARYNAEQFEWFRFFSYAWRPRVSLLRSDTRVVSSRDPDPVEAVALYAGQRIVVIEEQQPHGVREWELGMSGDSLTGLLSWLEAAPPGVRRV